MNVINYLLPRWKVTSQKVVTCEMESILFKRTWEEDRVLEIQTSADGRKRAFWVKENSRVPVEYSYVAAFLGGI